MNAAMKTFFPALVFNRAHGKERISLWKRSQAYPNIIQPDKVSEEKPYKKNLKI